MQEFKEALLEECLRVTHNKLINIQKALDTYKQDLLSETKSSAGDKHETGRAMLQLEMEKLGQQYQTILQQKQILQKIETMFSAQIKAGSLVLLNGIYYFLATSIGLVNFKRKNVYVVSAKSPIGNTLLSKKKNHQILFNGKSHHIDEVY